MEFLVHDGHSLCRLSPPKAAAPELGHGTYVHNGRDSKRTKEDVIRGGEKEKRGVKQGTGQACYIVL